MCGEQIKKITSDWKSNGIDRKFLSRFHDTQNKPKEKYEPNIIMAKVLCYNYFPKNIIKHLIYYQVKTYFKNFNYLNNLFFK